MYKIDNRRKNHKGRYTVLGIILGVILTGASIYLYDHNRQPILDNVNEVKQFAIKQIPKDSPVIAVVNDNPVEKPSVVSQPVETSPIETQLVSEPKTINISALESSIHQEINNQREQNGLKPLEYDQKISIIAESHSLDMNQNNYFDHTSLTGLTVQDRFSNYPCFPIGENIAEVNLDTSDSIKSNVVNEWMNSPEHRTNILEPIYHSEGIGVNISGDNVMITEDFC